MYQKEIERIKEELARQTEEYIKIIINEYKEYIPKETVEYLNNVKDFKDIIKIEDTGTISLYVFNNKIYFPTSIFDIVKKMKLIPGYGKNKEHKTCSKDKMIINDNTYIDFIKHAFFKGITPEEYYKEILLHEVMHLCGAGGANPLSEGFTELKTRQLAYKYNLLTSSCGYPKEVKIVSELEKIFGKELSDKITFQRNPNYISLILSENNKELEFLYTEVLQEMEKSFTPYINKKYPGVTGPIKKTISYNKINYDEVYKIIDKYKNQIKIEDAKEQKNENKEQKIKKVKSVKSKKMPEKEIFKIVNIKQNENIKEILNPKENEKGGHIR